MQARCGRGDPGGDGQNFPLKDRVGVGRYMRPATTGCFLASSSASDSVTGTPPSLPAWPGTVASCVTLFSLFSVVPAAFIVENGCIWL